MLDTDTCIFLMRGESQALAAKVQSVPLQQQVMSAVTFAELTYGVQASAAAKRKQNQAVLDSLALHLAVLDWPQDAAKHYAEIRADLKKRGAQLGAARGITGRRRAGPGLRPGGDGEGCRALPARDGQRPVAPHSGPLRLCRRRGRVGAGDGMEAVPFA